MTKFEFLEIARDKHGYKYTYPNLSDKILSTHTIDIIYKDILYRQKVVKHLMGRCPEKNTPTKTNDEFIKDAIIVWGHKYDYSLVNYKNSIEKIDIIYDGVIFKQSPKSHLAKNAPELKSNRDYFIKKSIRKWGDKYGYSLVVYIDSKSKVDIILNKTGEIFRQSPSGHLNSAPERINLSTRKTNEYFIKESILIHDNKFGYDRMQYHKSKNKIIITCPIHGDFLQYPQSHLMGNGCKKCNDNKGEKLIAKYLNRNNISHYRQHKFDDCKNEIGLPFDFYIPKFRLIIEFDRTQQLQTNDKIHDILINDNIKSDYCEDNFIEIIKIRHDSLDKIYDILDEVFKYKK